MEDKKTIRKDKIEQKNKKQNNNKICRNKD